VGRVPAQILFMSQRRRPRNARQPSGDPAQPPVTKVKNPADVVTIVPYLLGFDPVESIVVVALEGPRQRFGPCARMDLVDADATRETVQRQVDYVGELVGRHGFDPVLVIAFSASPVRADRVVHGILERLRDDRVTVVEAVRADGSRWWSYTCHNPVCCPAEGTPYDAGSSRVAAEAVVAGLARAPSRDALREQFEPQPFRRAAFEAAVCALWAGLADIRPWTEDGYRDAVLEAVAAEQPVAIDLLVQLVLPLQHVRWRDLAWSLMTRANAADHFAFWCSAVRATPDLLLAPVGSLAAFAAWLSGRGVLASHAAERVLQVEPDYSMAWLLLDLCASSIDPAVWPFVDGRAVPGQAS
jgi:hypothetical protein